MARATGAALTQIAGAGKTKEVFLSATAGPYKKSGSKKNRWVGELVKRITNQIKTGNMLLLTQQVKSS